MQVHQFLSTFDTGVLVTMVVPVDGRHSRWFHGKSFCPPSSGSMSPGYTGGTSRMMNCAHPQLSELQLQPLVAVAQVLSLIHI